MPRVSGYRIAAFALILMGLGITAAVHTTASASGTGPVRPVVEASTVAAVATGPVTILAPTAAPRPVVRQASARVARKPAPVVARPRAIVEPTRRISADRYPYAQATTNAHDTWGFTQRQCVSYVAWRLAASGRAISNAGNTWGSAFHWDEAAGGRVSARATVGAVAHWNAGERSTAYASGRAGRFTAGGYGHVGYVTAVYPDGSVEVAQYNIRGDRQFSSMRMTAPRYLYFG